jgi:predicted  nucleic acid-binding Zn-ribbon protein
MASRDEFVQKLKDRIDTLNSDIDDLEDKARKASGDAERELEKQRALILEQRDQFEARLDALKQAGEDNWEHLKAEAEHALKALSNSVSYFKSHFR